MLRLACSLTCEDVVAKTGSTMMAREPDRVHAKATTLGLDARDANILDKVAQGLTNGDNVSKRYTNHFEDRLVAYGKYKEDHDHFPTDNKSQLGMWAERQRGLKWKLDKGEHAKGMTCERASKLTALGFVWGPPQQGNRKWRPRK